MQTDIAIIGGGLCGLSLAYMLKEQECDFHLFEAKPHFGGRISGETVNIGNRAATFDLGPAWFWPGQPRMAHFAKQFELSVFDQFSSGAMMIENSSGQAQRRNGFAPMQGSMRIDGGLSKLIENFVSRLSEKEFSLGQNIAEIKQIEQNALNKILLLDQTGFEIALTKKVIFCIPPRIAAGIKFEPELPKSAQSIMKYTPTWMAGQAKFLAVYETPFWRSKGLSGDAMSQRGPMVEIHDASDEEAQFGALFGFIGIPAHIRIAHRDELTTACVEQLISIFGDDAAHPVKIILKDWAEDPFIATQADWQNLSSHPHYRDHAELQNIWDGQLFFSGTEFASEFGGFLEGALCAAEDALEKHLSTK